MRLLKQSSTAQPLLFLLVSSTDHVTAVTGLSPTVTLSKAGGSFNAPSGGVTEVANGWYKVAGNATDTGTLGALILHATGTGADPADIYFDVIAPDPQSATAFITGVNSVAPPTNWNLASIDGSGRMDVIKIAGTTQTARDLGASVLLSSGTGTGQVSLSSGLVTLAGTQTFNNTGTWTGGITGNVGGNVVGSVASVTAGVTVTTNNDKTGYTVSTVSDKTGYSLTQTFPSNFSALGINVSGHVSRVTLADTLTTYTGNTVQTGDAYARLGAPAGASHAADVAAVKVDTAAVKVKTDLLPSVAAGAANGLPINGANSGAVTFASWGTVGDFTIGDDFGVAGTFQVTSGVLFNGGWTADDATPQVDVTSWKGSTAPAMTGDAFARLGLPAGASISADVAAVKADTATAAIDATRHLTMIEQDGLVYRYTTNALEQAPSSGGGGNSITVESTAITVT